MWPQRDQFTNAQIPFSDLQVVRQQHSLRPGNHPASERSKVHGCSPRPAMPVQVADLVYITSDGSKTHARNWYLAGLRRWSVVQHYSARSSVWHYSCARVFSSPGWKRDWRHWCSYLGVCLLILSTPVKPSYSPSDLPQGLCYLAFEPRARLSTSTWLCSNT